MEGVQWVVKFSEGEDFNTEIEISFFTQKSANSLNKLNTCANGFH